MKFIRYILIAIAVIVSIVLIVSFIAPTEFDVVREITIDEPIDNVWELTNSLEDMDKWSPWSEKDPNMNKEYIGDSGTEGSIYKWNGDPETVGIGEQEIVKIYAPHRIDSRLRFKTPYESEADAFVELKSTTPNQTKARYGFHSVSNRPMNIMLLFVDMEAELGPDFEKGLKNLKQLAEQ